MAMMSALRSLLWVLVTAAGLQQAGPQGPLDTVRASNEQVQAVLARYDKIDALAEAELFRIIDGVTGFGAISARVIEPFCPRLSAAECRQFDQTFQRLLRVSSIRKLGRYRADRFEYIGQEVTGESALVRTLAHYQDDRVRLDYELERNAGQWKVVNYILDDVDTIRNYRKQFVRLFARNDFGQIIGRLQKKIAEYEQEY
jgi:ABC-type transporter MlaC component